MDFITAPITQLLEGVNYIYLVEIIIIAAIAVLLLFILYKLGLFRKER
jgi:hypothetical protein